MKMQLHQGTDGHSQETNDSPLQLAVADATQLARDIWVTLSPELLAVAAVFVAYVFVGVVNV